VIADNARPALAAKVRLRWDRRASRYMLLYPERGLVLNATGADIVQLCTGEHTVGTIVDQLAGKYAREPAEVAREVYAFLTRLAERGLLRSPDD
jgi:pyrroloquinoline quinone biosynthesis protein D